MNRLHQRLRALPREVLTAIRRGIEKESLRVGPDGMLADTPHPAGLGSALTHPHITTDFSESQLELITGVHTERGGLSRRTHRDSSDRLPAHRRRTAVVHQHALRPAGRRRHSDRTLRQLQPRPRQDRLPHGLAHRYGRRMQTISGMHYNFSMPEAAWPILQRADAGSGSVTAYQTDAYFHLIRNFRRHSWLLLYLFGASPTVCSSFVAGRKHGLQEFERRHAVPARRHLLAHGAAGLPERCAGVPGGELQQSRGATRNR